MIKEREKWTAKDVMELRASMGLTRKELAEILKWLAPIATIQTEEMLQKVRDEEIALLTQLLEDIGY